MPPHPPRETFRPEGGAPIAPHPTPHHPICPQGPPTGARLAPVAIIGAEDEDFENDIEPVSRGGGCWVGPQRLTPPPLIYPHPFVPPIPPPAQNPEDQNSPFQSLERLRQHPAYLMAFLHHAVLQFDSCPVVRGRGGAGAGEGGCHRGWGGEGQ